MGPRARGIKHKEKKMRLLAAFVPEGFLERWPRDREDSRCKIFSCGQDKSIRFKAYIRLFDNCQL